MRERHSRRNFLGVGLGCAAPLLLKTPLGEAASSVFTSRSTEKPGDPVVTYLRREAVRNYRLARAAVDATGRVPGEPLRTMAGQVGLIEACLVGKGDDVRLDESLKFRVLHDGRDATVMRLTDSYRMVRDGVNARDNVNLPPEPDFGRAGAALDVLQQRGVRRTTRLLRHWAEWEARQADRIAGAAARIPAAWDQKPGDDFGGYPPSDFSGISCDDITILLDAVWLVVAVLACSGQAAMAELLAVVAGSAQLAKDISCRPMTT